MENAVRVDQTNNALVKRSRQDFYFNSLHQKGGRWVIFNDAMSKSNLLESNIANAGNPTANLATDWRGWKKTCSEPPLSIRNHTRICKFLYHLSKMCLIFMSLFRAEYRSV